MTADPTQFYTPATGQRAYTLVDVVNSMNEQINGADDPNATQDAAEVINVFANFSTDAATALDTVAYTSLSPQTWDQGVVYAQGAWT